MTARQRLFQRLLLVSYAVAAIWTSASVPVSFGFPIAVAGTSFVTHLALSQRKTFGDLPAALWASIVVMGFSRHYFFGDPADTWAGLVHVGALGGLSIVVGEWLAERVRPPRTPATMSR